MSELRVALAQLACKDGDVAYNLDRIVQTAKLHGPAHDAIVFPEAYVLGFPDQETTRALAEPLDGPIVRELQRCAADFDSVLIVGMAERNGAQVYNTTVMVSGGGVLLAYRKVHLWQRERFRVDEGDTFFTSSWLGARIGLLICFDIEFPETTRALAALGAQVVFVTDGNMDPYGPVHHVCMQARAQENQVFVAMANRVGDDGRGTVYAGRSAIAGPYGNIVAEAGRDETVLSTVLSLDEVAESRRVYDYMRERRVGVGLAKLEHDGDVRWARIDEVLLRPETGLNPVPLEKVSP